MQINTHNRVGVPGAGLLLAVTLPAVALVGVDAPPVAGLGSCNHLTCVAGPYLLWIVMIMY